MNYPGARIFNLLLHPGDGKIENRPVIAHRLYTVTAADQILVLEEGRIQERGKHRELLELGGLYSQLWKQQQKSHSWKY